MNIETLLDNIDNSVIKTSKEVVSDAKERILNIRSGKEKFIKTRYNHLNDLYFGGVPSRSITTISGMTGGGKTTILKHIEDDIFDEKLNPGCYDKYVLLKCNYEMAVENLVVRRLRDEMKTTINHIFNEEFVEGEEDKFNKVFDKENNPNIYYIEKPLTPKEWYVNVRQFIINHQDKERIIVTIDHLGLVKGSDLRQNMIDTLNYQNDLKKEFTNVCFINLSQMNRDIESRTSDAKNMNPRLSDLYASSDIGFISDLILVIHNPFRLGIEKYMTFPVERYPHLKDYMIDPNRDKTAFETKGNVFWHFLKIRQQENDNGVTDNTLHIERLYPKPKNETTFEFKVEQAQKLAEIPRMDNSMDLWDDYEVKNNEEDDDEMPF